MTCPAPQAGGGTKLRVIDVLRAGLPAWTEAHSPSPAQNKAINALLTCRTAALGGHVHRCPNCAYEKPQYNSCRNRHCPNCQALDQARWVEAREEVLLPVGHHHVVFTVPSELRPVAMSRPSLTFELLMQAVREALAIVIREHVGGEAGITAILHTWTRSLQFHPHVHCIVTAGAWTGERWVHRRGWLVPIAQLKAVFRGRILASLEQQREKLGLADDKAWRKLVRSLPKARRWVVHIEPPMSDVVAVVKYLGQYTHRIAISDWRLRAIEGGNVTFVGTHDEEVTLSHDEFTRRFMQHVLPAGFHKIRHYGLYAPGRKVTARNKARDALLQEPAIARRVRKRAISLTEVEPWNELLERLTGIDAMACPQCGARMVRLELPRKPSARGPP